MIPTSQKPSPTAGLEGHGTTFRVTLPAARAGELARSVSSHFPTEARTPAAVLVVDAEPPIALALRRVLREHDVTFVTSGRDAIDLIVAGRNFDMIFSDLMMPHMSGMDLYDELAIRFPNVADRMVFMRGVAFTPVATAFLERTCNECLEKPLEPAVVRALVERLAARTAA
jgi:CheY-like chemotaxis protein